MSEAKDLPIRIHNGDVIVDAAFLAPKLGLSPEHFQTEMRGGLVSSVVEEGQEGDAGRIRVTFRYGHRAWRAIVEQDGSFTEARPIREPPTLADLVRQATGEPGDSDGRERLIEQARSQLCTAARRGAPVTYRDLALTLGLQQPTTIHQVTDVLEALMAEDGGTGRPFLAALAVSKARRGLPAPGFFDFAARVGRFDASADPQDAYHARELAAAITYWGAGPAASDPDAR